MSDTYKDPEQTPAMTAANGRTREAAAFPYRPALLAILAVFFALSLAYSIVTPAWEAHDEWSHYKYVEYLATHRALPPAGELLAPQFGFDESSQPPLYYVLAAIPVTLAHPDPDYEPALNPYATTGTGEGGVNMTIHDPEQESFPYRGTFLGLHLARLASIFMGMLGVFFAFRLAKWLVPQHPPIVLAATAITAFSPQYLFISSVVSNDVLAAALGMATLYFACRLALGEPRRRDFIGLGLGLGLSLLTKYTALSLVPACAVALVVAGIRARRRGSVWQALLVWAEVLLIVLATAGWWIGRNLLLGYPVSRDADTWVWFFDSMSSPWDFFVQFPWRDVPSAAWYGLQTFWASFGWGNVGLSTWVYVVLAVVSGISLLGCLAFVLKKGSDPFIKKAILFLAFSALSFTALPLFRESVKGYALLRGRFVLMALPAAGALIALGLLWWLRSARLRWLVGAALIASMLVFAAVIPFVVIQPAYARPTPPASQELPAGAEPLQLRFGDLAELYGYQIWPATVTKGKAVGVTLYWVALGETDENYAVGVYANGVGKQPYGHVIRYPGRGNVATSLWKPGDLLVETTWVPITSDGPTPCLGTIAVALFLDQPDIVYLPVTDGEGMPQGDSGIFGRFKIASTSPPADPPTEVLARFGDELALTDLTLVDGVSAGGTLEFALSLGALQRPAADYTLFVHLVDAQGRRISGADRPPLGEEYPTGLWDAGEAFQLSWRLPLPRVLQGGTYRVGIGLYDPSTSQRLTVSDAAGTPQPDGVWWLPPVEIAGPAQLTFVPLLPLGAGQ